jgi:hypothetical protein
MQRKSVGSKCNSCVFSSSNVHKPSMYLDVNHEKAPDTPVNNAGSSTTSHISWIPLAIDPYSDKLIVQ